MIIPSLLTSIIFRRRQVHTQLTTTKDDDRGFIVLVPIPVIQPIAYTYSTVLITSRIPYVTVDIFII